MIDDPLIQDVSYEFIRVRRTGPWQDHIFSIDGAVMELVLRANYTVFRFHVPGRATAMHYVDLVTWQAARVLAASVGPPVYEIEEPTEEMVARLRAHDRWTA